MASRRRGSGADPFNSDEKASVQQVDGILYGDLQEVTRNRVITRPVRIDEIQIDQTIQVRVGGLDEETVERYTQVLLNGGEFTDPIALFREGDPAEDDQEQVLFLADGFHRVEATRRALHIAGTSDTVAPLRARIFPGGHNAAIDYAEEANLRHGKALSVADKRSIFDRRMERGHTWKTTSDRQIGRILGVAHTTIGRWRTEFENKTTGAFAPVNAVRRGQDGREYDVSRIQRANEERIIPHPPAPKPAAQPPARYIRDEYSDPGYEEPYIDVDENAETDMMSETQPPTIPQTAPPYAAPTPEDLRAQQHRDLMQRAQTMAAQKLRQSSPVFAAIHESLTSARNLMTAQNMAQLNLQERALLRDLVTDIAGQMASNSVEEWKVLLSWIDQLSLAPADWREASPQDRREVQELKQRAQARIGDLDEYLKRLRG